MRCLIRGDRIRLGRACNKGMRGLKNKFWQKSMDRNARDSGIELLKILAIFLIVISHVAQTLTSENPYITYNGYIVDISHATTNIQHLILVCFRTFGPPRKFYIFCVLNVVFIRKQLL